MGSLPAAPPALQKELPAAKTAGSCATTLLCSLPRWQLIVPRCSQRWRHIVPHSTTARCSGDAGKPFQQQPLLRTFLEPLGSLMRVMPASGLWATMMA